LIGKEAAFDHLRPTTTAEMLDRAYAVAVRFAPVLLIASFCVAAEHLLAVFFNTRNADGSLSSSAVAAILGMVLVGEFTAAGALLAVFQGLIFPLRPLSPRAIARTAFRKLPGYLLTHLLYVFALVLAATISWGFFSSQRISPPAIGITAGIVTGVLGLYVAIRLSLAPIACLIEDSSPLRAFGRSWALTATRPRTHEYQPDRPPLRWLAIMLLPALVLIVAIAGFSAYSYFILQTPITAPTASTGTLKDLLWFTATWLGSPLYWAGLMALYVEYRMRHEALDFYLRIRELRQKSGMSEVLA
jgi:hypothetical protein